MRCRVAVMGLMWLFAHDTLADHDGNADPVCSFSHSGSTWNLVALRGPGYHVDDSLKNTNANNFSYYFNFCANINPPRDNCGNTSSPAFQVKELPGQDGYRECNSLGGHLEASMTIATELLDVTNPAAGIRMKYVGGDMCGDLGPRNFTVNLICANDVFNLPDEEPVVEEPTCNYEIFLRSIYGCPTECPVVDRQLCGGKGECGYDTTIGKSRCFCYDTFFGDDCTDAEIWTPENTGAVIGVSIVCIILLVLLIFVTHRVWKNVNSLRLDPEAYSSMGGDLNAAGHGDGDDMMSARMDAEEDVENEDGAEV